MSSPEVLPAVYSAGTVMVRVGASYIEPDDDTGKWRFNRNVYPFLDGLRYDIDSETTWNVTAGFMPIDHFSVEVGYIGNSEHDVDLFGLQSPFERDRIKAGDIERRTGLLMFNWFPVCIESWVQPYVGIGGHYTDFDNVRFSFDANDYFALVSDGIGQARLFVEDTWGWAGQLGVDVMFGRDSNWLVNVAVQYLDVEFDADLHFTVPSEIDPRLFVNAARTDVEFDPWIYNLGIGYKF
ncbi:Outer membrane protein W [Microbulbifer marinus]|uniref:Outer membrane protein W n=1 Tax=Microbulbifer marinus TaxID=658218 RepID=A0A1H3VL22_9GAMM|nr:Outer membrane protein W [Microbulbifer marinus]